MKKPKLSADAIESTQRGMDLEHIAKIIEAWRAQMPDGCYDQLRAAVDGYKDRCAARAIDGTNIRNRT